MMKSVFHPPSILICFAIALAAAFAVPATVYAQESGLELVQILAPEGGGDADGPPSIWLSYGPKSDVPYTFWYGDQDGIIADWSLPEGYSLGATRLPPLKNLGSAEAAIFVFEGETRIAQQIMFPEGATPSLAGLSLSLTYQVCEEACIQATGKTVLIPWAGEPGANETNYIPPRPRQRSDFWIRADDQEITIGLNKNLNLGGEVAHAYYLTLMPGFAETPAPLKLTAFKETGFLSQFVTKGPASVMPVYDGLLVVFDDGEEDFTVYQDRQFNDFAMASGARDMGTPAVRGPKTYPINFILVIFFALLGGLILNVMPCVFPVLALKIFSAIKAGSAGEAALRKDALAYTAGIMVTFAALAGILIAIRAAGIGAGWGYQLQSPVFVLVMALIFFAMGLNFAGVFEVPGFLSGAGQSLTERRGSAGSFFTGALTTLVAAPCTAPFMVTAIAYALAEPPSTSIGVFLALGLGLAIPYLLIGFVPAARRMFPKPGQWMVTFRAFLAFPMFGAVVWMVWILSIQSGSTGVLLALAPMVALAFAFWSTKVWKGGARTVATGLAAVAVLYAVGTIRPDPTARAGTNVFESLGDMQVTEFSPARLVEARGSGKGVFIHHWAAWCIICIMHENTVFTDPDFQQYLAENDIVFMQVDRTLDDQSLVNYMEAQYGRSSQPIDVFYSNDSTRPPVVFPQIFTTTRAVEVMAEELGAVVLAEAAD